MTLPAWRPGGGGTLRVPELSGRLRNIGNADRAGAARGRLVHHDSAVA